MTGHTPAWLAEKQAVHARKASPGTCPGCGAPVLRGLDADRAALTVTVDAAPTTPAGELRALIAGRATYDLVHDELDHRDQFRLAATRRPHPVHVDHVCGATWPAHPAPPAPRPAVYALPDTPAY